jgi:hypothetical protein
MGIGDRIVLFARRTTRPYGVLGRTVLILITVLGLVFLLLCRFTLIAETGRVRHFRALSETRLFSRHPNWDWRPIFVHLKWD